ncbi:basic secretory protein-like protein [Pseudoalteromonas fenneropenaei]|uniref:Basic secretory protein-like protein n=1 Tax=Pseudoalteromonas fenneropenaei TaxID=1737459 RepID=A0ABV7CQ06_9GAMM
MKKIQLTFLALTISSMLSACNDGSGFVSTQESSTAATPAAGNAALRNMSADTGAQISAPDAVDSPAAESVENLLDGNAATKFLTFSPIATVVFRAVKPAVIKGYSLTSAGDAPPRDPKTWLLEASSDGETWISIDSQSDQVFATRSMTRSYSLSDNETSYQYFRFSFENSGIDEWGGNLLQLADLGLIVVAEAPLVSFTTTTQTPAVGQFVIFSDTSLVNPSKWEWQFEDGTPATSSEQNPYVVFNSLGAKTVSLKASNDKGDSVLVQDDYIRVWNEAEPWAGFEPPSVSYVKHLPEHQGQQALERVLPNLTEVIQEISLGVAKVLYHNVTEAPVFNSVRFETGDYDFPAAKGGTDKDMVLMFDVKHIANLAGQSDDAIRNEIIGVLWHELTHGYNHTPAKGVYQAGQELHSYLEGLANYVRIQAGYLEHYRGKIDWIYTHNEDAYNQTSFFLEWVAKTNRNTDFIRLFNQSAKTIPNWSFDAAFKAIFGPARGIEAVLKEYQTYLQTELGIVAPLPTPVAGYRNFTQDEGVSISTNATHIGVWGEGPEQLIDNNVKKKFNAVLETPWWLSQYLPQLLPINEVNSVAVTLTLPTPQILQKYSVATGNDNAMRDPTSWLVYGSQDGEQWTPLGHGAYPQNPTRLTTYQYDLSNNSTAYGHYRFEFSNNQSGSGVGGDNGRLVQIGELALLTKQ